MNGIGISVLFVGISSFMNSGVNQICTRLGGAIAQVIHLAPRDGTYQYILLHLPELISTSRFEGEIIFIFRTRRSMM